MFPVKYLKKVKVSKCVLNLRKSVYSFPPPSREKPWERGWKRKNKGKQGKREKKKKSRTQIE